MQLVADTQPYRVKEKKKMVPFKANAEMPSANRKTLMGRKAAITPAAI